MAVVQVERGFHIVMVYGDGVVDERESRGGSFLRGERHHYLDLK